MPNITVFSVHPPDHLRIVCGWHLAAMSSWMSTFRSSYVVTSFIFDWIYRPFLTSATAQTHIGDLNNNNNGQSAGEIDGLGATSDRHRYFESISKYKSIYGTIDFRELLQWEDS